MTISFVIKYVAITNLIFGHSQTIVIITAFRIMVYTLSFVELLDILEAEELLVLKGCKTPPYRFLSTTATRMSRYFISSHQTNLACFYPSGASFV